jgi:hypothetical protein
MHPAVRTIAWTGTTELDVLGLSLPRELPDTLSARKPAISDDGHQSAEQWD